MSELGMRAAAETDSPEQAFFGEGGQFEQYSGAETIRFGEYEGTLDQAMAECPHLRMLPPEALEAVLKSTVVIEAPEQGTQAEAAEAKKKLK